MSKISIRKIVHIAILIAVEIVLTRFCSINTPIVRIGFGFIPIAMIGMLYGPLWAGGAAVMADFIGAILFPTGAFFLGFTFTAFLTGLIYGLLLHHKGSWWRVILAVCVISLILHLCLDTLWIYMITGKGYLALLPTRIIKCVFMVPIQVLALRVVFARIYLFHTPVALYHKLDT